MPLSPCSGKASPGTPQTPGVAAPCCAAHQQPGDIALERNRFFTGKYMTERDFQQEQWYFLSRGWLHQRTLHGWGVVCGLEVEQHPSPECARNGWVVVLPGMAIDCYGRTIVVRDKTPVQLKTLASADDPADSGQTTPPSKDQPLLLGLRYREECVEQVPLLYDDHHCGQKLTYNRVAESGAFCWKAYDASGRCWGVKKPTDPCAPCTSPGHCLDPACDCGAVVPLALLAVVPKTVPTQNQDWPVTNEMLCFNGVRYVPGPLAPQALTHVCRTSWTLGKKTSLAELETPDEEPKKSAASSSPSAPVQPHHQHGQHGQHHQHGQHPPPQPQPLYLWIKFDRALKLVAGSPTQAVGLDAQTFVVEYTDPHDYCRKVLVGDIKVEAIPVLGCQRGISRALITFDPKNCRVKDLLKAVECNDVTVHVTLKCDFIQDYRGRSVDGNFLGGAFPSGDGVEGGTFESWFTLTKQPGCGGGKT